MNLRALAAASLLAFALSFAAACSDRSSDDTSTPDSTSSASATSERTRRATATTTPAATETPSPTPTTSAPGEPLPEGLQTVLDRTAEIRELSAPPNLKVEFIPRSKVTETIDSLTTDDDRRLFREATTLYRLLGHMANDQTLEEIYEEFTNGAVLGFYNPPDKALWVVYEDGDPLETDNLSKALEETLAHEFVHAIQDYHFDLTAKFDEIEDSLDASLAYTALVEGDAVTNEQIYSSRYLAFIPAGRDTVILAGLPVSAQLPNVPPSIVRELYFPYTTGANWVQQTRRDAGVGQINDWFEDPPLATSYVLHPELWAQGWVPQDVTLPDLAPALGNGWARESGGSIGEFGFRNYLQLFDPASTSAIAAAGWAGDAYAVYVNGDESVAAFRVHFENASEAQQFADAHADFLDRARAEISSAGDIDLAEAEDGDVVATTEVQGTDVLFVIGSNADMAEKALNALLHG